MPSNSLLVTGMFETQDVVALYLGKIFNPRRIKNVQAVAQFLTGSPNLNFNDQAWHLQIKNAMVKQHEWLGSVRYHRTEMKKKIQHLESSHGMMIELTR